MGVANNMVVAMHYDLKDKEGNLIESTKGRNPLEFITGHQNILPKLENKILSSEIGDKFSISLDPVDAYGEYQENYVREIEKTNFPEGMDLQVGMDFMADTEEGRMVFVIKEIKDETVIIDFNHPLAGQTLVFDVEVVASREASPEELQHGHVHSGAHDHGCGDGGCGSGCSC